MHESGAAAAAAQILTVHNETDEETAMNTPARLGAFTLGLATVFGLAFGAGHLTGPIRAGADEATSAHMGTGHNGTMTASTGSQPGGLQVSDRGYTLTKVGGAAGEFAFRIVGPAGRAVTAFDTEHDKRMHLIVVRRDLSGFRHVHPRMYADGTWRVASPLDGPGTYRAFADFKPTGAEPLTLGIDAAVPGAVTSAPLPPPAASTSVDGYTVTMAGRPEPGRMSKITLNVSRDGKPVTDLQPYLGAYGHLVVLREGDLAYLHVHPDGAPGDGKTEPGPDVTFDAEVPSVGTYRLYLDFQHAGKVHTAEFTVVTPASTAPAAPSDPHQH
jgi:hypothetical protein